jgi:hypothetical protein
MSEKFTAADKRDCLIREANMRRIVYPRRIEAGKMRQGSADREIALMEAIAADYKVLADAEMVERARNEEAQRERTLFG